MPSAFSKVRKHVKKKKGDKITSLHENSRDAQRLRRAGARDDRVARLSSIREQINKQWIDRVAFFQQRLPETLHPLELEKIQSLVKEYIERNDSEINQLKAERRPGRPPSSRQALFEQQRKADEKELDSGFWMPSLQDEETLVKLDEWSGDWVSLGTMKFVRIDSKGVSRDSQFPPRGAS